MTSPAKPTRQPTDAETRLSPRRRYRSPLRAQRAEETRAALVTAATDLFASRGWAATGMRDIARQAGVATETLYSHFPSKTALLQQVIDVAAAGDDAPVPVAGRPEFRALGEGSRAERVAATASFVAAINQRTAGLARVLREAAHTDTAMAEMLRATRERQRLDTATGAELLLGRPPTETERDELWALVSFEVYHLLVETSGWRPEQYEAWLADILRRVLPDV